MGKIHNVNEKCEINLSIIKKILIRDRVSKKIGLLKCIQCGLCTGSCPAARYSDFSPREIINAVLKGNTQIIQDKRIWNCFSCYTCHMRCPRGNSPITVIQALKQISIEKGDNIEQLKDFLAYGESFIDFGTGAISREMFNKLYFDWGKGWLEIRLKNDKIRDKLGLSRSILPENAIKEVRKILNLTGFIQRIENLRKHME
ncbi:MAG: 4Fe-4S dicluster domain-containing protein [Promethearchaeota archaeon]